jgi:uncharacterized protein (TIGR00730 family)
MNNNKKDTSALPINQENFTHIVKVSKHASKELKEGLRILRNINQEMISIFGSHVTKESSKDFINCNKTAYALGKCGYAIITGGGPGIMKAANSGAMQAKTASIGFKARFVRKEQHVEDNLFTHKYSFNFLFVRRFCLAIESRALIFYPGGYGTLNELFEYVTLIETHMADAVPVICVNKKYWDGMFKWLKEKTLIEGYIEQRHLDYIQFADTPEEILKIIENK